MGEVQTVRGPDLQAASRLMVRAWETPCWRYTPSVLRDYLERPSGDPELTVGLRRGGELVGLFAGVPTEVRYRDAVQRTIFTTFLTVDPQVGDVALPLQLYRNLLGTARAQGRTHVYTVFFPSKETTKGVQTMFRLAGAPMEILSDIDFMVGPRALVEPRLVQPAADRIEVVPYAAQHRAACARLLGALSASVPLAAVVPEVDTEFVLAGASTTTTVLLLERGVVRGLACGRERVVERERPQRNVQLDYWFVDPCAPQLQQAFLDRALAAFFARGIDSVTVPLQGELRRADFLRRGFLETPRAAALAVAYLDPGAARVERGLPSFFEVY
jgi:hypothetical protein